MARSVLKIDVEDDAFRRFEAAFDKYQKARALSSKAPMVSPKGAKDAEETIKRQTTLLNLRNKAAAVYHTVISENAQKAARAWDTIANRSRQAVGYYTSLKGLAQTLGITALAGIGGGLWGADRLAMAAGAGRRSASGLGVSYGERQAFGLTYGRLVDTGSFLGGVSEAKGNIASGSRAALLSLGINPDQGGTADIAGRALDRIRQLAQQTPEHLLGVLPQSHNLGELNIGTEELRRLKGTSSEEYLQYRNEYFKRRGQMGVDDPALKASQDLAVQLDVAGEKIKSSLIIGLAKVAPELTRISDGLSDVAQKILGSKGVRDGLVWMAGGLKQFGDYIQDEAFKKDVKEFVTGVGNLASAVTRGLKILGIIPDSGTSAGNSTQVPMTYEEWVKKREQAAQGSTGAVRDRYLGLNRKSYQDYLQQMGGSQSSMTGVSDPAMKSYAQIVSDMESRGSGGYQAMGPWVKGDRAHGKYGIMGVNIGPWSKEVLGQSVTAQEFLMNPRIQDEIFKRKFGQYLQKYGNAGDAYSMWHSGVPLNQAIKEGRRDVSMSTQDYVAKLMAAGTPKVVIENNTGGNTITQTNQVKY